MNNSEKLASLNSKYLFFDATIPYVGTFNDSDNVQDALVAAKALIDSLSGGGSGVPSMTSESGKWLTNNGSTANWSVLPNATNSIKGVLKTSTQAQVDAGTDDTTALTPYTAKRASWNALPSQTGNSGKFLTTNGTTLSWATTSGGTVADASTTTKGKIEIADQSEVNSGTSTTLAMTPATAKNASWLNQWILEAPSSNLNTLDEYIFTDIPSNISVIEIFGRSVSTSDAISPIVTFGYGLTPTYYPATVYYGASQKTNDDSVINWYNNGIELSPAWDDTQEHVIKIRLSKMVYDDTSSGNDFWGIETSIINGSVTPSLAIGTGMIITSLIADKLTTMKIALSSGTFTNGILYMRYQLNTQFIEN